MLGQCEGDRQCRCEGWMRCGCGECMHEPVGDTHGSGIVPSAADVLGMSVLRGMRCIVSKGMIG